jgi:iron complex outermembrane receptor protein
VTQLENTGDVLAYGVEVDSAAKLTKDLRLSAAASYVHANYDNFLNSCYPNQTVQQGCVNNAQNLGGTITQGAPRFSGNLGADYNISIPDPLPFNSYVHLGYAYTGEIQYGLEADPMLRQGAHGSLDATLGFTSKHDKWELQIYGKNLTNQHYYTDLYSADNYIGRVFAVVPRDFWRYGGIRLTAKF